MTINTEPTEAQQRAAALTRRLGDEILRTIQTARQSAAATERYLLASLDDRDSQGRMFAADADHRDASMDMWRAFADLSNEYLRLVAGE